MIRSACGAVLLIAALTAPAVGQTAGTLPGTGGNVGSGAVSLPALRETQTVPPTANAAAGTSTRSGSAGAATGRGGASSNGANTATGSRGTNGARASGSTAAAGTAPAWVVCPPAGSSGLASLFAGSDLSCAP